MTGIQLPIISIGPTSCLFQIEDSDFFIHRTKIAQSGDDLNSVTSRYVGLQLYKSSTGILIVRS